jgi:AcrR family transcriptional regulator
MGNSIQTNPIQQAALEQQAALKKRALRADGDETRRRILDAADELFSRRGFSATSMRAIAHLAEVNLAAINYHFSSKKGLLTAALHRLTVPINELRLQQLDALESEGQAPDVEAVMHAFFAPLLDAELTGRLPRLVARIYGEPGDLARGLLEQEFGTTVARFIDALQRALPGLAADELSWRMHLVIGSMVHLLNFESPLDTPPLSEDAARRVERLTRFAIAGLKQAGLRQEATL